MGIRLTHTHVIKHNKSVQFHSVTIAPPPCFQAHRQLAPSTRYSIGQDFDKHIDAIAQNSMAVAHVSRDQYREVILKLCSEVGGAGHVVVTCGSKYVDLIG